MNLRCFFSIVMITLIAHDGADAMLRSAAFRRPTVSRRNIASIRPQQRQRWWKKNTSINKQIYTDQLSQNLADALILGDKKTLRNLIVEELESKSPTSISFSLVDAISIGSIYASQDIIIDVLTDENLFELLKNSCRSEYFSRVFEMSYKHSSNREDSSRSYSAQKIVDEILSKEVNYHVLDTNCLNSVMDDVLKRKDVFMLRKLIERFDSTRLDPYKIRRAFCMCVCKSEENYVDQKEKKIALDLCDALKLVYDSSHYPDLNKL